MKKKLSIEQKQTSGNGITYFNPKTNELLFENLCIHCGGATSCKIKFIVDRIAKDHGINTMTTMCPYWKEK